MVSKISGMLGFDMSNTTLGAELRKARRGMNLSLEEMAPLVGVNLTTLWRLESDKIGTPSRPTLASVSRSYGLPLEYLAQLVYCGKPAVEDKPARVERLVGATA